MAQVQQAQQAQVQHVVVLDNGGGTIKIGLAGEAEPRK
jgi:actin-related protein